MKNWKKRLFAGAMCAILCLGLLAGCGQKADSTSGQGEGGLPQGFPKEFVLSDGADSWNTVMTIQPDGSFAGVYRSVDPTEAAPEYPRGTVYLCEFSGQFGSVEPRDKSSYTMKLDWLNTLTEPGEDWFQEDYLYVTVDPFGLELGTDFVLYGPKTAVKELNEKVSTWWGYCHNAKQKTLSCWGLENVTLGYGFFTD